MAKFIFNGINEYIAELQSLEKNTSPAIGKAIYNGAGWVADCIREAVLMLPVDPRVYVNDERWGIHPDQKEGLLDGLGISKLRNDNGYLNVKIGFDGYNKIQTERWPNGQPNVMVARATESGTSFLPKFGTISQTVRESRRECERVMRETIDEEIQKITK